MPSGSRRSPAGSWAPLAELVGKLQREERYHRMHVEAWLTRLALAGGEARERLEAALRTLAADAPTVFTPLPEEVGARRGWHPRGADARARGALARTGSRRRSQAARPADARRRSGTGRRPDRPWRGLPLAVGRVHRGPPRRPGSDLVSERGTQVGIAALGPRVGGVASGHAGRSTAVDAAAVRRALDDVADPELPMVSIVELGMVGPVERRADDPRRACSRRSSGARRSSSSDRPSRRVSRPSGDRSRRPPRSRSRGPRTGSRPAGLAALAAAGIAPPTDPADGALPVLRVAGRWSWTASSGRPSAGRSSTAGPAASRSKRSSRSDRGPGDPDGRRRRRRHDGRRHRAAGARGRPRRPAPRPRSRGVRPAPSVVSAMAWRRRAARLDLDADAIDDWVDGRAAPPAARRDARRRSPRTRTS